MDTKLHKEHMPLSRVPVGSGPLAFARKLFCLVAKRGQAYPSLIGERVGPGSPSIEGRMLQHKKIIVGYDAAPIFICCHQLYYQPTVCMHFHKEGWKCMGHVVRINKNG